MAFGWKEWRGSGIIELDVWWDWWVQWSGEEEHLEWDARLSPVFHHNYGIQSHVDTGWETQDSQSHRWSIGTPSYHSQGSYRWLVEWLPEMVQKCRRGTRDGRKWLCLQWIGFHIEMFPLWTFVGYKHPTPSILGQSVVNPNIDDNRYLQQFLILASESRHKIIVHRNMSNQNSYNKW